LLYYFGKYFVLAPNKRTDFGKCEFKSVKIDYDVSLFSSNGLLKFGLPDINICFDF